MVDLTQKEKMLLQDQKSHEEMCIKKYTSYANLAQDEELKQIFLSNASQEQNHLNSINQILNGQVPSVGGQQNQQSQQNMKSSNQNQNSTYSGMKSQSDADLCQDLLATEKYVSGTYDTAVFEFRDANIRKVLNHIQSEEQKHGEAIFNYMQKNGMYNPQ